MRKILKLNIFHLVEKIVRFHVDCGPQIRIALFTNMRILKFRTQPTIAFFAAVNHLNGPLRKQNFTLRVQKVMVCDLWISIRFVCGRDPFNQTFRKFRSKTQWIGSVQPEKFRKNGPPFEVVLFSRSDRLEFWLNGSRPVSLFQGSLLVIVIMIDGSDKHNCEGGF